MHPRKSPMPVIQEEDPARAQSPEPTRAIPDHSRPGARRGKRRHEVRDLLRADAAPSHRAQIARIFHDAARNLERWRATAWQASRSEADGDATPSENEGDGRPPDSGLSCAVERRGKIRPRFHAESILSDGGIKSSRQSSQVGRSRSERCGLGSGVSVSRERLPKAGGSGQKASSGESAQMEVGQGSSVRRWSPGKQRSRFRAGKIASLDPQRSVSGCG